MSITIRLLRLGKKHQESYRIVVAKTQSRRNGKPIEEIGIYNPKTKPAVLKIDNERMDYWKKNGALISDGVKNLLKSRTL